MAIQLDTVGLVVKDMGKALAFYRVLGLAIPTGQDDEAHVEFTTSTGFTLGFDAEATVREVDPQWQTPNGGQRLSLQFKCDAPTDVDATYDKLMVTGYRSYQAPWDSYWGQRFARVIDPDDNVVNLFC
jgi:uncharacterized glyoxalase superfamily protein PhnB